MLRTKNNLKNTLLKYFILFSISILGLLWILQAILFQSFYKNQKINDVYYVSSKLKKIDNSSNFYQDISNLAIDKNVCIEINNNNYDLLYQSNYIGKGCILNKETTYSYKFDLEALQKRFPNAAVLQGAGEMRKWNCGQLPMLLAHPASQYNLGRDAFCRALRFVIICEEILESHFRSVACLG